MAEAQAAPITESAPRRGPGIMTLVKATAFISVIVLLEVAAATVFLPSAEETRRVGEEFVAGYDGDASADKGDKKGQSSDSQQAGPPSKEVTLGVYHVVSFNP